MTNPDNIVRVRARNGGRASVYEANGWAQAYTSGLLEGNGVTQNTSADMNVLVGGSATKPDVVLAINPADYKIGLDIVGQQAIAITAPASNSRISAIVAYTDDLSLATSEDTVTGSPSSCGLIVVNGTASASPSEPTDNQIRTAITADGATGSQASYCIIATILVESTTTTITDSMITIKRAQIGSQNIDCATLSLVPGELIQDYGNKTNGQTFVAPNQACIFTAECVVMATQGGCRIYRVRDGGNILCAGIPFTNGTGNDQVVANFMALPNEEFSVSISKSGLVQSLKAYTIANNL